MMEWPELDALLEEMRGQNEEGWQRAEEFRQQFSRFGSHLEIVGRQYEELQVRDLLQSLNERLLGGLGTLEIVQSGAGIECIAGLAWPPYVDPRASPAEISAEGVYRIDVRLGPDLESGRPRIRISGAKRLEANLPTSAERFRAALLSVFRNPQFVTRTGEEPETEEPAPGEGPASATTSNEGTAASPATPPGEESQTPLPEAGAEKAPAADAPPTASQENVIAVGPATEQDPAEHA